MYGSKVSKDGEERTDEGAVSKGTGCAQLESWG